MTFTKIELVQIEYLHSLHNDGHEMHTTRRFSIKAWTDMNSFLQVKDMFIR